MLYLCFKDFSGVNDADLKYFARTLGNNLLHKMHEPLLSPNDYSVVSFLVDFIV